MKRFFNSCGRHRQSISLLVAGVLPSPERAEIENHLAACVDCRNYFEEIKTVTVPLADAVEKFPRLQPSPASLMRWANAIHAAARAERNRRFAPLTAFSSWWQEVIWPWRRAWAGLAAIWLMIFAGNLSLHDRSPSFSAKSSPASPAVIASFKDQQKILAELLADHSAPREAERQKKFSPQPRTERADVLLV
jgi:anti-sigma factor RsiW